MSLFLVYIFRYQRAKSFGKNHAPAGRESVRKMTADDAQAIVQRLAELETPRFSEFSMVMALFRVSSSQEYHCYSLSTDLDVQTYGIPSISILLVATGDFNSIENASKRAAGAGVLLLEFGLN